MPKRKSLPDFKSYEEASEWLDAHSTDDLYARSVKFSVSPNLKIIIVDAKGQPIETLFLKKQMSRQIRRLAVREGLSSQRLIENWLKGKIREQSQTSL